MANLKDPTIQDNQTWETHISQTHDRCIIAIPPEGYITETGDNSQLHKVKGDRWISRLGPLLQYLINRLGTREKMDMGKGVDVLLCDLVFDTIWMFWNV
jgi:hypothetical protein